MSIEVVTTFSEAGYYSYGRLFLESFLANTSESPNSSMVAYHEGQSHDLLDNRLEWRNLNHDRDRARFTHDHGSDPAKVSDWRFPNRQTIRFCHKVFAITDAARRSTAEWLVWMDADVIVTGKPNWEVILPETALLTFLGRPRYYYTECGFVAYRVGNQKVRAMLEDMRRYYTSGEIFRLRPDDRHDSRCFDICRARSSIAPEQQHSLTDHANGTHVWHQSPLAAWSSHQKGPKRKVEVYGGVVP